MHTQISKQIINTRAEQTPTKETPNYITKATTIKERITKYKHKEITTSLKRERTIITTYIKK